MLCRAIWLIRGCGFAGHANSRAFENGEPLDSSGHAGREFRAGRGIVKETADADWPQELGVSKSEYLRNCLRSLCYAQSVVRTNVHGAPKMVPIRPRSITPNPALIPVHCLIITVVASCYLSSSKEIGYEALRKSPDSIATPTTVDTTIIPFLQELSPTRRTSRFFENKQTALHGIQDTFVNSSKGNLTFLLRDLVARTRLPIVFGRVYDSSQRKSLDFGPGWKLTLLETIGIEGSDFVYIDAANSRYELVRLGSRLEPKLPGINPVTGGDLSFEDGKPVSARLYFKDKRRHHFTAHKGQLRLTRVETPAGRVDLVYKGDHLETVSSGSRTIFLERGVDGKIARVFDEHGRAARYGYNRLGQLETCSGIDGQAWSYEYDPEQPHLLKSVTDPRGATVLEVDYSKDRPAKVRVYDRVAKLEFRGRVTRITRGSRNPVTLRHSDNGVLSQIEDPAGLRLNLHFDGKLRFQRLTEKSGNVLILTRHGDNRLTIVEGDGLPFERDEVLEGTVDFEALGEESARPADTPRNIISHFFEPSLRHGLEPVRLLAEFDPDMGELAKVAVEREAEPRLRVSGRDEWGRVTDLEFQGAEAQFTYTSGGLRERSRFRYDGHGSVHAEMAYDRAGNLTNLTVQYANGLQMNQEYRVNMHNQVAEVTTTVTNAFEQEAQEEEWKISFGYDREGRVQSVSAHPREAHVLYGDSGAVSKIIVDGIEVWSETGQASNGSSLLDAGKGPTARVIAPWWTSHIYADLEHIVYNRPIKSDYWGVWYDGDASQSLKYDIDFDSKDRIHSVTKDRLMLAKATRQPPRLFDFDKPSNSLFLPPEYASINCQMCTSYLAGIKVSGTQYVILDGDDDIESPGEVARYTTRATIHCGLGEASNSPWIGVRSVVHRIDYGDGHFDQKVVSFRPVIGVSRTKAKFRHIYVTPGLATITADAWCSGCSVFPFLPRIDSVPASD